MCLSLQSFLTFAKNACTSSGCHPKTRVNMAMVKPSIPSRVFARVHRPNVLCFWSTGQGLAGHLNKMCCTLTKPAAFIHSAYLSGLLRSWPTSFDASNMRFVHLYTECCGVIVPSSLATGIESSCISSQPPGLRFLWGIHVSIIRGNVKGESTLQSLLHHFFLLHGAVKLSGMDEVELFCENPWFVGVIDEKGDVWWTTKRVS